LLQFGNVKCCFWKGENWIDFQYGTIRANFVWQFSDWRFLITEIHLHLSALPIAIGTAGNFIFYGYQYKANGCKKKLLYKSSFS